MQNNMHVGCIYNVQVIFAYIIDRTTSTKDNFLMVEHYYTYRIENYFFKVLRHEITKITRNLNPVTINDYNGNHCYYQYQLQFPYKDLRDDQENNLIFL